MCGCKIGSGFHCARCHRAFTSLEAFDRHQRIDNGLTCLDPAILRREDGQALYEPHAGKWRVARPGRAPHPQSVR
jgi:hypothetical protein